MWNSMDETNNQGNNHFKESFLHPYRVSNIFQNTSQACMMFGVDLFIMSLFCRFVTTQREIKFLFGRGDP